MTKFEEKVVDRLATRLYELGEVDDKSMSIISAKRLYRLIRSCEAEQTLEEIFDETSI